MRVLEIVLGEGKVTTDTELRGRNPGPVVTAFLDDDCLLEITTRFAGHGFRAVTWRKVDGPLAEAGSRCGMPGPWDAAAGKGSP